MRNTSGKLAVFCIYHICITQKDLLNYCTKKNYTAPSWPEDYWPKSKAPDSEKEWQELKNQFEQTQKSLIALLKKEETDLLQPVASTKKHSLLREIGLVIEHNAYHGGQLVILLRLLGVIEN
ncbi:DinB family protein [Haloflavibacter putidus]|uniref:DinB family protein n=1 Tax=Haloflavibacter putidus TaxID=2576776 RepID=UPI002938D0AB|nr:DinB family protein [Haloflavibacter putidus]